MKEPNKDAQRSIKIKHSTGDLWWILAFSGMTECRGPTVIPAKAGIQLSDYFELTWALRITVLFNF